MFDNNSPSIRYGTSDTVRLHPRSTVLLMPAVVEGRRNSSHRIQTRKTSIKDMYVKVFKRAIDIFGAILGLLLLSPFLLLVALALCFTTRGNPFFIQTRLGYRCKPFRIIKFKTMTDKKDVHGNLLPDELRVTKLGEFCRKLSLDEFPQLLNVLKGDMSLVGPRPWVPEQMEIFSAHECKCRGRLKPGMTGLAQVCGRNDIPFRERLPYDVWYVRNVSPLVDLKILWLTLGKVLKCDGIQQRADALRKSKKKRRRPHKK